MASAVPAPASSATSVSTTCAPSLANSSDAAFPIPLPPPVIRATLPSRRMRPPSGGPGAGGVSLRYGPCDGDRRQRRGRRVHPRSGRAALGVVGPAHVGGWHRLHVPADRDGAAGSHPAHAASPCGAPIPPLPRVRGRRLRDPFRVREVRAATGAALGAEAVPETACRGVL